MVEESIVDDGGAGVRGRGRGGACMSRRYSRASALPGVQLDFRTSALSGVQLLDVERRVIYPLACIAASAGSGTKMPAATLPEASTDPELQRPSRCTTKDDGRESMCPRRGYAEKHKFHLDS